MYLSFKDICLCVLKALILTLIFVALIGLIMFDYKIGINYCDLMNIPTDLALSVMSLGMAINITIIMFVIEIIVLYFIIKKLKRIQLFNNICEFLSIDY